MYCPRPANKRKKVNAATPGKKTVNPPAPRTESCNASSSTVITDPTSGGSTSTTIYVPGPVGPAGPRGWGFKWEGQWAIGADYKAQSDTELASVVFHNGSSYIATADNTSTSSVTPEHEPGVDTASWSLLARLGDGLKWEGEFALNVQYYAQSDIRPASVVSWMGSSWIAIADNISADEDNPEHAPNTTPASWKLLAQAGDGFESGEEKNFFDSLKDDVFDWVKNASVGELLLAGAAAVGVLWAGSKIIDSMSDSGEGDGEADQRYSGSDGYITTSYVAPDIKDVVTQLCEYGGIPYDVSALPDEKCQLVIGQNTSIRTILAQLALAFQFDMVDSAGVLKFVPLATSAVKTLVDADIGYGKGTVAPARYGAKRFQGIDLPRSVTLSYVADDTDYNTMTQVSQLPTYEDGQDVQLQVPVTLEHTKAKQITEISLIQAHIERTQYKFPVSLEQLDLEPGDVIGTPMGNIRIKKIGEVDEGIIEIEGTDAGVAEAVSASDLEVQIPPASNNIPIELGYSQAFWIDPTALSETDTGTRIYAAVHGFDKAGWPGAAIYVSENGGASYEQLAQATKEATIGLVAAVTPSADYHVWDETTTISVQVKTNELSSVSAIDVLNGKNWAQVGQEVIGFRTATLTAPKTYTLSGLLRGRRGTEQFVDTHVANELFVLLDDALVKIELATKDRTTTKKFKVVTLGSSLDKVTAEDVYITSNNLRMWTVENPKLLQVGSDWQFSFGERVRFLGGLRDNAEITHDADWAGFGVIIYDTDGTTVKNKFVTTSESWTYTAAQQVLDFGSHQTSIKSAVMQLSQDGVPGYPTVLNS